MLYPSSSPSSPEVVKKFREWEMEKPCNVPGREKSTPPKKALDSPLPAMN
jgi:hypothetical protein